MIDWQLAFFVFTMTLVAYIIGGFVALWFWEGKNDD